MAKDLKGFTALITGGSSGIGFEMAKQLLSEGASVVIAARNGKKLENALEKLKGVGDAYAVEMDVTDESSIDRAAEWFASRFDHIDMLVNNAGIGRNAPGMEGLKLGYKFYEVPVSSVKASIDTNLTGFFAVTVKFLPMMLERGSGSILYVSTGDSTMTKEGQINYGPGKAGAEAMAEIMRKELEGTGITVNIITPGGFTDTPMAGEGVLEHY